MIASLGKATQSGELILAPEEEGDRKGPTEHS